MNNKFFDEIKYNFGFGLMRLPMLGGEVDFEQTSEMVDAFMNAGFNYFDTAKGYLDGKSELAFKKCVAERYSRESFVITDKLTTNYFEKEEDIRPLFESQLNACGVEYFDFYLMHSQTADFFEKYKRCKAYEIAFELKKDGKIKHVGISFHDNADVLDTILTEYPEIEVVQLQMNYLDYDDPSVQGKQCYDVCVAHNKPVIAMEPVKGGSLVRLPDEAQKIISNLNGGSNASYAVRYAADFPSMMMVISGMSNVEQMNDNISTMMPFVPLTPEERSALDEISSIIKKRKRISCTGCGYCLSECPKKILIPELFADLNAKKEHKDWNSNWYYDVHTQKNAKASECIKCGKCEKVCPQKLEIRKLLQDVAEVFE